MEEGTLRGLEETLVRVKSRIGKEKGYHKVDLFINPSDQAVCYNNGDNLTTVVPPVTVKVEKK